MSKAATSKPAAANVHPRIHFLDHFRDMLIVSVLLWHASVIYGGHVRSRWFFQDQETGTLFDIAVFTTELFLIPLLFYLAGHFAVASIARHGARRFLIDKAKRLMIPFVFGVVFLVPINFYLNRCASGTVSTGYLRYWLATFFTTDLGPAHLWYLYVLFFFCAVHAAVWSLHRVWRGAHAEAVPVAREPALCFLLGFWLFSAIGLTVVTLAAGYGPWVPFLGMKLFTYQPSRCLLDLCYYFLGVYGAMNGWTWAGASRGKAAAWLVVLMGASVGLMAFRARYAPVVDAVPLAALVNSLLHALVTLSALCTLAMVLRLWCNVPYGWARVLSRNSYAIYIVHQPVIVWIQYVLTGFRFSAYLKFAMVAGVGLSLSLVASHFVLRRIPGLRNVL